jgi:predicted nuclease of predicted toxin-antitoxin system
MSLRFFIDHCVPTSVVNFLREAHYEVFVLREQIPTDSPDPHVIAKAQELDAILLSLNGDFSDIVSYPPENYKGIISLQLHNHPEIIPAVMKKLLEFFVTQPNMDNYKGKLFLVEVHRIRVRESKHEDSKTSE